MWHLVLFDNDFYYWSGPFQYSTSAPLPTPFFWTAQPASLAVSVQQTQDKFVPQVKCEPDLLPPAGRSERLVHEKLHLDPFQDQIGSPGRGQRCQTRTRRAKPAHYFSGASITEGICWKTTLTSYNFWPCRKFLFWYMASDPQSCQYLLYSAKPSLWHICSYLWWNFCTFSSERRISRMFCMNLLHKQPNEHCRRSSSFPSKVWTCSGRSERLVHEKLHLDPFQDQTED